MVVQPGQARPGSPGVSSGASFLVFLALDLVKLFSSWSRCACSADMPRNEYAVAGMLAGRWGWGRSSSGHLPKAPVLRGGMVGKGGPLGPREQDMSMLVLNSKKAGNRAGLAPLPSPTLSTLLHCPATGSLLAVEP